MRNSPVHEGTFDLVSTEKETLHRVNKTLSAIEKAISAWDSAKEKSIALEPRVKNLRRFHKELTDWERQMLISISRSESRRKRTALLREFTEICSMYA